MLTTHLDEMLLLLLGLAIWRAGLQHLAVQACWLPLTCMGLRRIGPTRQREWQQCSIKTSSSSSSSSTRLGCGSRTTVGAARTLELAGALIRTQECPVSIGLLLAMLLLLLVLGCQILAAAESSVCTCISITTSSSRRTSSSCHRRSSFRASIQLRWGLVWALACLMWACSSSLQVWGGLERLRVLMCMPW
jgi:hypothetical protein